MLKLIEPPSLFQLPPPKEIFYHGVKSLFTQVLKATFKSHFLCYDPLIPPELVNTPTFNDGCFVYLISSFHVLRSLYEKLHDKLLNFIFLVLTAIIVNDQTVWPVALKQNQPLVLRQA